ncbi:hypothetical protein R3X25_12755 [Lutibacter sp. TH_r2]|uniref:hypothetical protein n=1 Tax=Lutibacter sp. TH_r2 TaxID=3082083 RepID=UPI002953B0F4|nr:hypothetical protein [Lutibacter sp. TH_r2]MDV7188155.1 hypothetical protein [Lutibacter sp. TH_r2]
MRNFCLTAIVLLFISTSVFSQATKKFIDTGSVENQFEYLFNKSNKYQQYKVVPSTWILKLKKNVSDSLKVSENEIIVNYKTISSQKSKIDSLTTAIASAKETVTSLTNENQSISLLGLQIKKGLFKTIMFSIIGGLIALLIIFIGRFKQSNSITKEVKDRLKETEEEFENHRKTALEREQKVRRQLQDELNKQKKE